MTDLPTIPARKGLTFEQFEVGQSLTSAGRKVTEADVMGFAGLTGDWNPIHTDADYAAQQPFGQRVAHGLLGLSIAVALAVRLGFLDDTLLAFREIDDWKFSQPVYLGDTIRARLTVSETRPVRRLGGGMVGLNVEIINQHNQVVQHGIWRVLVKGQDTDKTELK